MSYEGRTLRVQAKKFDDCAAIAKLYGEGKLAKRLWQYAMELRMESVTADEINDIAEREEACRE